LKIRWYSSKGRLMGELEARDRVAAYTMARTRSRYGFAVIHAKTRMTWYKNGLRVQ
jgi:hypothetical protein